MYIRYLLSGIYSNNGGEKMGMMRAHKVITLLMIMVITLGIVFGLNFFYSKEVVSQLPTKTAMILGKIYSEEGATLSCVIVRCNGRESLSCFDGSYYLMDIPVGTHEVTASLNGFQTVSKMVTINENEHLILNFYLPKAVGIAKIHGYVYDSKNMKPIAGGTIILIRPSANLYAVVNEKGYYEFKNLPAGTYTLITSIPEYAEKKVTITVTESEIKTFDFYCEKLILVEPPWG